MALPTPFHDLAVSFSAQDIGLGPSLCRRYTKGDGRVKGAVIGAHRLSPSTYLAPGGRSLSGAYMLWDRFLCILSSNNNNPPSLTSEPGTSANVPTIGAQFAYLSAKTHPDYHCAVLLCLDRPTGH